MTTAADKLREATQRVQANRDAAQRAAAEQVPGEDQTEVQPSRAQQSPPAPQPGGDAQ